MEEKQELITSETIIIQIIDSNDPLNIKKDLRQMIDEYLIHTHDESRDREDIYSSFLVLSNALDQINQLNTK